MIIAVTNLDGTPTLTLSNTVGVSGIVLTLILVAIIVTVTVWRYWR